MTLTSKSLTFHIGLLAFCLTPISGFTAMYKWVDEEGNTHYTQQPPPDGIAAETVQPPPGVDTEQAVKELTQEQEQLKKLEENRIKQEEELAKQTELDAQKKENCRISRDRLSSLQNSGRVRAVDEEGNVTRITEEEHQSRIKEVQENIKKYCN